MNDCTTWWVGKRGLGIREKLATRYIPDHSWDDLHKGYNYGFSSWIQELVEFCLETEIIVALESLIT